MCICRTPLPIVTLRATAEVSVAWTSCSGLSQSAHFSLLTTQAGKLSILIISPWVHWPQSNLDWNVLSFSYHLMPMEIKKIYHRKMGLGTWVLLIRKQPLKPLDYAQFGHSNWLFHRKEVTALRFIIPFLSSPRLIGWLIDPLIHWSNVFYPVITRSNDHQIQWSPDPMITRSNELLLVISNQFYFFILTFV